MNIKDSAVKPSLMKKLAQFSSPFLFSLLAIFAGFIVGALVLLAVGYSPILAYKTILVGIFRKPSFIAQSLIDASPLILTGLSVTFAFKTGLFNIGAEGQYMVGAVAAFFAAYFLPLPPVLLPIVALIVGAFGGAVWGGIVGLLKAKKGISEVLSSIMFNWIAFYMMNYIINLPGIKNPKADSSFSIPETARITYHGLANIAGKTTRIHWGILLSFTLVFVILFILDRTTLGFKLKAVGYNKDAAEAAGISVRSSVVQSMAISGALAGLAGAIQLLGVQYHLFLLVGLEGYGFNGLAVAFIGNITPIGTLLGGLFFGAIRYGGNKLTLIGMPREIIDILIGTIVYFVAATVAIKLFFKTWKTKLAQRWEKKK